MKVDSTTSQTFKWNSKTHIEMTKLALKNCKLSVVDKNKIALFSQQPDFIKLESGFFNNTHFYFPNSKNKSFGIRDNKFNALKMFIKHFQNCFSSKEKEKSLQELGYAAHYLQDASTPLHTTPGSLLEKALNYSIHSDFEKGKTRGATSRLPILIENFKPEKIEHTTIIDLFKQTAEYSQKPQFNIKRSNKKNWPKIQQNCFNYGVNVSRIFFERMLKVMDI